MSVQIVGYGTGVGGLRYDPVSGVDGEPTDPTLVIADDGLIERVTLAPGTDLAYRLGPRHCAGVVEDGAHEACDDHGAPYCEDHTSTWPCARCIGNCHLPLPSCREEHAVYLAAFPPATFKVGVTRLWRLVARLREQGARRAAHIHTVSDGRIARELEAELAGSLPDRVTVDTKIRGLARDVDPGAWEDLLDGYPVIETFDLDYGLRLADRPVHETLAAGVVRGAAGRIIVLDNAGSTYATDLRDLVGHEVEVGGSDRELQSSLGAFG